MSAISKYNKLHNSHVLVLGGSAGIGFGVAQAALAQGAAVSISSSSAARVEAAVAELAAEFGPDAVVAGYACDLGGADVEAQVDKLFRAAAAGRAARPVNHVVFTASGKLTATPFDQLSAAAIIQAAHMRVAAPILVGKVAATHLAKSADSSYTLTTGTVKDRPIEGWTIIGTLAGGLESMTRQLALEMAPIRVNVVCPGLVDTNIWDDMLTPAQKQGFFETFKAKHPTGRLATPDTVAEAYLYSMRDWNATGSCITTSSGVQLK